MEKQKLYTVTKSSTDGTFKVGDIIWISENGDLNSVNGKGWLPENEWNNSETKDFEVEPCEEYYLDITNGHETVHKR